MPPTLSGSATRHENGGPPARPWWGIVGLIVILGTGFLLSWHSLGDLDIWFHLRAGEDLLAGQGVTQVNHYSFTEPDHQWVNHEWMFQALAAFTGPSISSGTAEPEVTGWNALRAALVVLILLVALSGDHLPRRLSGREGPSWAVWAGVPVLAGLLLIWPRLTLRPELFSYILLILLVRNLEQFFQEEPRVPTSGPGRWLAMFNPRFPGGRVFLITLIWAQFHGFSALAPILVILAWISSYVRYPAPGARKSTGPFLRQSALLLVLTILALTLTPNGVKGLLMPLKALTQFQQNQVDLRATVSELVPLQDSPDSLGLTIGLYRISLACGVLWILATLGRISMLRILVFLAAAVGAWLNQRTIGFFGVAFMLLFTGAPHRPWRLVKPGNWPNLPHLMAPLAGLTIFILVAVILWPQVTGDGFYLKEGVGRRFGTGVNPARFPVMAASRLGPSSSQPLFANLDAAAFMLAQTGRPVFIDGRTEAYSAGMWAEYLTIKRGTDKSLERLKSRGVVSICLATGGGSFDRLAGALLESPMWELVTAEGAGLLFQRSEGVASGTGATEVLNAAAHRCLDLAAEGSTARRADQCLAAGKLFQWAGNEKEQEAAFRKGLSNRSDHPALNHNLGNLLLDQQDYAGAYGFFKAALAGNPRLSGSALNAGVCLMRQGDFLEASQFFEKAVGISPKKSGAWVNLAVARHQVGDRPGAIKALERALEMKKDDPRLNNLLREWKSGAG